MTQVSVSYWLYFFRHFIASRHISYEWRETLKRLINISDTTGIWTMDPGSVVQVANHSTTNPPYSFEAGCILASIDEVHVSYFRIGNSNGRRRQEMNSFWFSNGRTYVNIQTITMFVFKLLWVSCPSANFRRYYFYFMPDQAQTHLDHWKVLDELWCQISFKFNNR